MQTKNRNAIIFLIVVIAVGTLSCTCALADKPVIYHVDLRYTLTMASAAECYDIRHTAVCVQGLVNRESPRVFLSFSNDDIAWLDRIREAGGLCEGWEVKAITYEQLFTIFRHYINGVVFYDPDPATGAISTSLVATTVAGVEGGIALRKDTASSTCNYLINTLGLPVLVDLAGKFTGTGTIWGTTTPSTGSAKCDAYVWAKQKYIDTGRCNPALLSNTLDLVGVKIEPYDKRFYAQLFNLDYIVSKKGFCLELSPWADEAPSDDLNQPLGTDLNTLKSILNACNQQTGQSKIIKMCGYPNWHMKYTNWEDVGGKHDPVALEWEFIRILTAYNTYLDTDAGFPMMNASFYTGLLPEMHSRHYVQNPPPTYNDMVSRGLITSTGSVPKGNYVMIGMGDYDGSSWVMDLLANPGGAYDDPNKQYVYCNWGVDPNAVDRTSVAFDYMYRHKTDKDYFIAWDSGAGYINPAQLYGTRDPSNYPSGVGIWQKHCTEYYRFLDYSITAWLLNGNFATTPECCSYYTQFSGDGIGVWQSSNVSTPSLIDNIPISSGTDTANSIINYSTGVNFRWYRMTPLTKPSDLKTLQDGYPYNNHRFLDAYTYNYLMRYCLGGSNNYREAWVNETTPRIMKTGQTYSVAVTVRNDGWDTWSEAGSYRLAYAIVNKDATPVCADYDSRGRFQIPSGSIAPGQSVTFTVGVVAPSTPGTYDLYYDIVRDGTTWFREQNNLECKKTIIVVADPLSIDTDGDGTPDVTEEAEGTLYWHAGDKYTLGPVMTSVPSDAGDYTNTSMRFTWGAATDTEFNVAGYYCMVGTTPGGSDLYSGYVGNVRAVSIPGGESGKTYYGTIQAVNDAGYFGNGSTSNGITIDSTAPSVPAMPTDGGLVTASPSITFNWTHSTDALSGIDSYNCRIGTTYNGSDVFLGNIGNMLSKTITGIYGKRYYCSVQAKDKAKNLSSWSVCSDGILLQENADKSIDYVKSLQNQSAVGLISKEVTAIFGNCIYIEESNRTSGIRITVSTLPDNIKIGSLVDILGTLLTDTAGERYISASTIEAHIE
ncbi:MAG: hypothetical protein ABFD54_00475 [Armatimonadota bacterium]|nr:hypothetical protein [bacterium]